MEGQRVWDRLVHPNDNVVLVPHSHGRTVRRADSGAAGNLVAQISQGCEFEEAGGNGYTRLLHFRPASQTIDVFTYSPYLQRRRIDAGNDFSIEYGRPQSP